MKLTKNQTTETTPAALIAHELGRDERPTTRHLATAA